MIVTAMPPRGKEIDLDAFADLTTSPCVNLWWEPDGQLTVEFAIDLPASEQAAVRRRIQSRNANEEELRRLAEVALVNNRTYLAIPTPTQAQAAAQIAVLTRQSNGVIRQLLGFLDGTD